MGVLKNQRVLKSYVISRVPLSRIDKSRNPNCPSYEVLTCWLLILALRTSVLLKGFLKFQKMQKDKATNQKLG